MKLVSKTLNEYMEVDPAGELIGDADAGRYTFEDFIEIIDNTKGQDFTIEDLRKFGDFLIEEIPQAGVAMNLLKYLFGVHPELTPEFEEGGPIRDELDRIISTYDPANPMNRPSGPDPRMN